MTKLESNLVLSDSIAQVVAERTAQRYRDHLHQLTARTDRVFALLMAVQWLAMIVIALWITPRTWIGATSQWHIHVLGAILVGGGLSLPVMLLAWWQPGATLNRYVISVAQVLTSALLIHLCGGRVETHFHVFGSLAFLALYRDWRILLTATVVVALDHMLRGIFWPESVFGVSISSTWRWIEHAGWVLFEDSVLITACIQSQREMQEMSSQWAFLSVAKEMVDTEVQWRVAELEQNEEQMRESSLRVRKIIDTANEAFVVASLNGTIEEWSVRAESLFGWSTNDAVGQDIRALLEIPELSGLFVESGHKRADGVPTGQRMEAMAKLRGGKYLPVDASVSFYFSGDEQSIIFFFYDISRRKEMQAQLLLSQKMQGVGQLAAGIAHEINTPTQYAGDNLRFLMDSFREIEGLLAQLDGKVSADVVNNKTWQEMVALADLPYLRAEIPTAIEQALDGIQRISLITRAMKDFSHPGSHAKQDMDPRRIIENSATVCRNEWKYLAELRTEFDPELKLISCLPGELSQVMVNLIVNAAQAIGEVSGRPANKLGVITVRTRRAGEWAEIFVEDNGPGIPPEICQQIFDPFFTTKEVGKGTGQGLAIAHAVVVEKHGGTISVASEVGQGTTFTLRLPLHTSSAEEAQGHVTRLVFG